MHFEIDSLTKKNEIEIYQFNFLTNFEDKKVKNKT
jgi:hypothetical protein